jgi:high-affinity Fe2+/Pb2+ permease
MIAFTWIAGIVGVLGVAGAIAAMIFVPAVAIPIMQNFVAWILKCKPCLYATAAIALCVGSWWWGHHQAFGEGYNKAIAAIAAKDKGALDAVHEATKKVDECAGSGREWNTVDGVCR